MNRSDEQKEKDKIGKKKASIKRRNKTVTEEENKNTKTIP